MKLLADCMYATLTLVSGTLTCRSACVGLGMFFYLPCSEDPQDRDEFTSAGSSALGLPLAVGRVLDGATLGIGSNEVPGRDHPASDDVGDALVADGRSLTGHLGLVLHDADDEVGGRRGEADLVGAGHLDEAVLTARVGHGRARLTGNTGVDAERRVSVEAEGPEVLFVAHDSPQRMKRCSASYSSYAAGLAENSAVTACSWVTPRSAF